MFNDLSPFELAGLSSWVTAPMCLIYGRRIADTHPRQAKAAMITSIVLSLVAIVYLAEQALRLLVR